MRDARDARDLRSGRERDREQRAEREPLQRQRGPTRSYRGDRREEVGYYDYDERCSPRERFPSHEIQRRRSVNQLDRSRSRRAIQRHQRDRDVLERPRERLKGREPLRSRPTRSNSRAQNPSPRHGASFSRQERASWNGRANDRERRSSEGRGSRIDAERTTVSRSRSLQEKSKQKSQEVPQDKVEVSSRDGFSLGQLVKARYLSGSFYSAKVEAFLKNGHILIVWADGDANDRSKLPEELRKCDENGQILEEEQPQKLDAPASEEEEKEASQATEAASEDPDAKLTPAEREQAARIREFQRRCQESGPSPMQEVKPKQQAAPLPPEDLAPKVTFDERPERLEEKLLMLSTQYMKLHEQITTDTAASEKQMQKLMNSGAGQSALTTFRMEVMSKQSGQRLSALQIQEQIFDLKKRLINSRGVEVEVPKEKPPEMSKPKAALMPVPPGPVRKTPLADSKSFVTEEMATTDFFSPIQWREKLFRQTVSAAEDLAAPAKLGGDKWEKPRDAVGLELLGECVTVKWDYVLKDEDRRSFLGYLSSPLDSMAREDFFGRVQLKAAWTELEGGRKVAWMVRQGCTCQVTCERVRLQPQEFPNWMIQLMGLVMPFCGITNREDWPATCHINFQPDGGWSGWNDDDVLFRGKVKDVCGICLSLGATQKFELSAIWPESKDSTKQIELRDGDLLTIEGMVQKHFTLRAPEAGRPWICLTPGAGH